MGPITSRHTHLDLYRACCNMTPNVRWNQWDTLRITLYIKVFVYSATQNLSKKLDK